MNIKHKTSQIRASLEHFNDEEVAELIKSICDGLDKLKKHECMYVFTLNKANSIFKKIDKVKGILSNFDLVTIVFKDSEEQVTYNVCLKQGGRL